MTVFFPETSRIKLLALMPVRRKMSCASTLVEVMPGYQSKIPSKHCPKFYSSLWQLWLWLPCLRPAVRPLPMLCTLSCCRSAVLLSANQCQGMVLRASSARDRQHLLGCSSQQSPHWCSWCELGSGCHGWPTPTMWTVSKPKHDASSQAVLQTCSRKVPFYPQHIEGWWSASLYGWSSCSGTPVASTWARVIHQ